jgi:hypothetical protein
MTTVRVEEGIAVQRPCAPREGDPGFLRRRTCVVKWQRYVEQQHRDLGEGVNRRLVRVIGSVALCLGVMGVGAYAFGHATRSDWVWWLAPLTVALDGSLLLRAGARRGPALLSPSELPILRDLDVPLYLASSGVATGVTAWAAYTGNRLALLVGAAFAILGRAYQPGEEPTFEGSKEPALHSDVSYRLPGALIVIDASTSDD